MRNPEQMSAELGIKLEEIRTFLSSLQGEVTSLESSYGQVLRVLENLEKRLESAADRDDLTGLLRRKAFLIRWEEQLKRCIELGRTCSVLMIDIDHFKKINDTYGHAKGDEVIKRIAGLLQKFASPDCLVGRYGGEEFIVACVGDETLASTLGEQIRAEAEHTPGSMACTLSIGVSSSPSAQAKLATLTEEADRALYEAKALGRNRVRTCSPKKSAA